MRKKTLTNILSHSLLRHLRTSKVLLRQWRMLHYRLASMEPAHRYDQHIYIEKMTFERAALALRRYIFECFRGTAASLAFMLMHALGGGARSQDGGNEMSIGMQIQPLQRFSSFSFAYLKFEPTWA